MESIRGKFWFGATASLLLGAGIPFAPATASAQAPSSLFVNNPALRLPIQLDDATRGAMAEVKLYAKSQDGDWQCVASVASDKKAIEYIAPCDGVYSFLFVLVDKGGRNYPASLAKVQPHRVVVVHTQKPDVELKTIRAANGDSLIQANVIDAYPDPNSIVLSYRTAAGSWRKMDSLNADSPNLFMASDRSMLTGTIKAIVRDRAGNETCKEFTMVDGTAVAVAPVKPSELKQPVFVREAPNIPVQQAINVPVRSPETPLPVQQETLKLPTVQTALEVPKLPERVVAAQPAEVLPASTGFEMRDVRQPAWPKPLPSPALMPESPLTSEMPRDLPTLPTDPSGRAVRGEGLTTAELEKKSEIPLELPSIPKNLPSNLTDSRNGSDLAIPTSSAVQPVSARAAASDLPVVRIASKVCALEYSAAGTDPKKADHWLTRDDGKTWEALANEAMPGQGLRFTLPGNGIFGLRIRPQGGDAPPAAGERPDCKIEVCLPPQPNGPSLELPQR